MNWVDLLIVALIAWMTFRGFQSGLIRQVVRVVAIIGGIVLAGLLYDDLSANIGFLIEDATTRNLVSFIAIVAGVVIAGTVLAQLLKTTASILMLGPLDSIGGGVLGFVRGVLYVQAALFVLAVFPANETVSKGVADSTVAAYFLENVPVISIALPSEFDHPGDQLQEWRERVSAFFPDLPDGVPAGSGDGGTDSH